MPPVKNRPMPIPAPTAPHPPVTFMAAIRTPLLVQLAHIALSSLWNGAGLWRVAHGQAPLGPSASLVVLGLVLGTGALMVWGARSHPRGYALASAAMGLALLAPITGALVLDAAQWPSPWWHWGGLALNAAGLAGNLWGLRCWHRYTRATPRMLAA